MDEIRIEDLEIYAAHGVYPEERINGQKFLVDAVLYMDTQKAGWADELELTTDYGRVCHFIEQFNKENTYRLIEAAAEHLVRALLLAFPQIERIKLELKKPNAPIGLPFGNVSVRIERGWKKVYLGIGSNLGDRQGFLDRAVEGIQENELIREVRCSQIIATKPYGENARYEFLNGAVELKTLLTPYELLDFLHRLEAEAGRERKEHWGPRTLDLDILFFQDFLSNDPALTVPHPDLENREFVLEPLNELCPWLYHPVTGKTVRQMLMELRQIPSRSQAR